MSNVTLQSISRHYVVGGQKVHALQQIDLIIEPGDYVSVMGPSGSGKSTLLNLIGLLDRPSTGRYLLDDEAVNDLPDQAQARIRLEKIGFVFQFFHLIPRLTAAENIELPMILAGRPPEERRQRVQEALEAYGLKERGDHRPDQLSGGQRQRVAIARATMMHPSLLLADEPTGNLDHQSGVDAMSLLERLNREGVTLILVTHNLELGARAERQLTLKEGRIVADSHAP